MRSIPILLLVFATLSIGAAAQTLTTFAVNPKGGAYPTGINDNGDVVGIFGCPPVHFGGPTYCGFLRSGSTGANKHLGNGITPLAVNDSDEIVGTYRISAFYWPFGGTLTQFFRGKFPDASAINTAGYIAGLYSPNQNSSYVAFLMNPQGQISTIFAPSTGSVENVSAMNNSNQVVGCWQTGQGIQGFVYSNGTVNGAFVYPNAVATCPTAINDAGEVAGTWTDSTGFVHGFIWTQKRGFTSFDAPKTTHTIPLAINNSGTVVGYFATKKQTAQGAFLYSEGTLTVITVPGARSAQAVGINSQGTVLGDYSVGKALNPRGFLYQP